MRRLMALCVIGLLAGSIFGGLLKLIELLTDKKVYTLLLNVDYFPILKDVSRSELMDFMFHLIVSMIVVIVLFNCLKYMDRAYNVMDYVWLNIAIAFVLYLTTTFSERTPLLTDWIALAYWTAGHIVYGLLIGWFVKYIES